MSVCSPVSFFGFSDRCIPVSANSTNKGYHCSICSCHPLTPGELSLPATCAGCESLLPAKRKGGHCWKCKAFFCVGFFKTPLAALKLKEPSATEDFAFASQDATAVVPSPKAKKTKLASTALSAVLPAPAPVAVPVCRETQHDSQPSPGTPRGAEDSPVLLAKEEDDALSEGEWLAEFVAETDAFVFDAERQPASLQVPPLVAVKVEDDEPNIAPTTPVSTSLCLHGKGLELMGFLSLPRRSRSPDPPVASGSPPRSRYSFSLRDATIAFLLHG